jgi:DNA-directed RNA polymerase subunit RPC12/RpoP
MAEHPFVLPLVARYPEGSRGHQPHWTQKVKCPRCKRECWAPGGYEEAKKSGVKVLCQECNFKI